jgi:hypothetical protein
MNSVKMAQTKVKEIETTELIYYKKKKLEITQGTKK